MSAPPLSMLHTPPDVGQRRGWSIDQWGVGVVALVLALWAAGYVVGFRVALTALGTLALLGAAVGLVRPALGLVSVSVLAALDAPMRNFLLSGGLLRWNTLNYWLLLVLLLSIPQLLRMRDVPTRIGWFLCGILLIGLLISPDLNDGVQHITNMAAFFGLGVYFTRVGGDARSWYWMAVICGVTGAGAGVLYYRQEAALPYINPNAWAYCPLTSLFAICLAFQFAAERRRGQTILGLLGAINFLWVFLSGSRGSLLVGVCCLSYLLLAIRGMRRRVTVVLVAALLALGISSQFSDLQEHTIHRVTYLFNSGASLRSRTSGRSVLAEGGLKLMLSNPLGVGTGGFARNFGELRFAGEGNQLGKIRAAHSAWVKTAAENGVIGLAVLAAFIASFTIAGFAQRRSTLRGLTLLTTGVLAFAFLSTEFQLKGLWFLAAGAAALLRMAVPPRARPEVVVWDVETNR